MKILAEESDTMIEGEEKITELIKRIAGDEEQALEELFELSKKKMLLVAKEYLIEKYNAEDVLSEAYLKIYRKAHLFKDQYSGYNWMYEIVKNTAIDFNRKFTKEKMMRYDESNLQIRADFAAPISKENIQTALKVLNEKEYQVIYLRIWENYTLQKIAEMLEYNTTRVFRTYNRALDKIRKVLE